MFIICANYCVWEIIISLVKCLTFWLTLEYMLKLSNNSLVLGLDLLKMYINLRLKSKSHSKMFYSIEDDNLGFALIFLTI